MTLDNVWEKREKEWRIDHPDLQDVCKTKFAKGKITEFDKDEAISEDYLEQVKSMVKVEYDGGTTDFLPLFYKPKDSYWDFVKPGEEEETKADEYDEENQCYKGAWQSFRAGDEVVLMLIDEEPKAVLGFADNCPRIGEQLIRLNDSYCKWTPYGSTVYLEEVGPDGKPLQVLAEAELIGTGSGSYGGGEEPPPGGYWEASCNAGPETPCELCGELVYSGYVRSRIYPGSSSPNTWTVDVYKCFVGPYIYLQGVMVNTPGGGSHREVTAYFPTFEDLISKTFEEMIVCDEMVSGGGDPYIIPVVGYAAIYDPEKHDSISVEFDTNGIPLCPDDFKPLGCAFEGLSGTSHKVYYHPHTKEELEAAGMWPETE